MIGKITEIPFNVFQEHGECHSLTSLVSVVMSVVCCRFRSVVQYRSSFPGPLVSDCVALKRRTGFIVGSLVGNDNRTEWMANQMVVCTSVHNYFAYRYLPPILMLITCLEGCTRIYVLNDHMQGQESSSTVNL